MQRSGLNEKRRLSRLLRERTSATHKPRQLHASRETSASFGAFHFHFRSTLPRFTPEALKANQALIDLLARIGERKKATPAQIALAWLLAQKPWIVPIPGTTKRHRLDENIGAAAVELTSDELRELDSAASHLTVQGAR